MNRKHYRSNKRRYHFIRRTSDRLRQEHGLSVIVPGQNKSKSYIEHIVAKAGTSYKVRLKAAIDYLIPAYNYLENLLSCLQQEGYEIKPGKYISCRISNPGMFYTIKDFGHWLYEGSHTGGSRPSQKPKQRDDRIKQLTNIQSKQDTGLQHWAKLQNLKEAAKMVNFITEHGIDSYEGPESKLAALTDQRDRTLASIKAAEGRIAELTLIAKYSDTCRKCGSAYDCYKKSVDKEKLLLGHKSEINLFEATARALKQMSVSLLESSRICCTYR